MTLRKMNEKSERINGKNHDINKYLEYFTDRG